MFKKTLVSLAAVAFACSVDTEEAEQTEAALQNDDSTAEIVENLQLAGYPADEIEIREGDIVFVGGDVKVSLNASREMIGVATRSGERWEPDEQFRQYRTNNLVSPTVETTLAEFYGPNSNSNSNPNSCQETNSCGGQAPGNCWCDSLCASYGDCCFDAPCDAPPSPPPPDPKSCQETNSCGNQAPGNCWCDNLCTSYGDCCSDAPC